MSIMRNLLNIILILGVCSGWGYTEGAAEGKSGEVNTHTIHFSSPFPSSSSCVLSSKASNTKSTLQVVHRHGPCSPLSSEKAAKPDLDDILRRDQARLNWIHAKLSKNFTDRYRPSQFTELPAKDGRTLGSGSYIVTIGIGTPKNDLSLIFDTGSDLTWTQCEPCVVSCYSQKEPKFNPSSSSSYTNVSCSSPDCDSRVCSGSTCLYRIGYGDGSSTIGFLAKEKFTLTNSDVFDGVTFGCGENNTGRLNGVAGLLGLGRGKLSFPSQATTYNNIFSYCLPSSPSFTGHLTFGSAGISNSVKYTPMTTVADASFYGLDIVGITVGDQKLDIPSDIFSNPGTIIDSGTTLTYLPPKAYAALRDAFREQMSNYTITSGRPSLDTCYDFTGFQTVSIPLISFSFAGGTVVDLEPNGIFFPYPIVPSQACLAFAVNTIDSDFAIFGYVQQKTLQVVYDGVGGRIGFAPNGCS